jgi:dTDP-4-dehydrorhamnose reductase
MLSGSICMASTLSGPGARAGATLTAVNRHWLVVGGRGMLGTDVVAALGERGASVRAVGSAELDVRDADACTRVLLDGGFDVVVNCSAYTAVDAAEQAEDDAFAVNAVGAANLARACAASRARLVQVSTDYVFDGSAAAPYAEDEPPAPRSAYGRTKAAGEWAARAEHDDVLVVRTAWLYGAHGGCFPRTIARALGSRDTLDVVDDQVGQPTWTADVARVVLDLIDADAPAGTYHATSGGQVSWYGFAQAVAVEAGTDAARVRPTTSASFVRPAPRPAYSVLGHASLLAAGVTPIGDWRERFALAAASVLVADGEPA